MPLAAHVEIDRLINDVIAAQEGETFDDLLESAQRSELLDGLRGIPLGPYLRDLRRGPEADVIAAAALRILATQKAAIEDSSVKSQLAQFLHSQYGSVFAATYKPPKRAQAFEIFSAFAPVAPTLEERVTEAIGGFRLSNKIEDSRNRLLKVLNGAAGRVLFGAFLDIRQTSDEISELADCVISLRDMTDTEKLETLARMARSRADQLEAQLKLESTDFAQAVVGGSVAAMRETIDKKLAQISPPALLEVAISDRPLPLLEAGVTCLATAIITNPTDIAASDVTIRAVSLADGIEIANEPVGLGRIAGKSRVEVNFAVTVAEATSTAPVQLDAEWVNPDHTLDRIAHEVGLVAHDVHIDWSSLVGQEPYALYPVEDREHLVGRDSELASLIRAYQDLPMANLYVTGQRRVGKTSLIRVLQSELAGRSPLLCIASVEAGEIRSPDGLATIGALGRKLARRLISKAGLEEDVSVPDFDGSLAPLTDVVDHLLEWDDTLRFLFVIDEFDELSEDTYRRDGPGDALFLPIRSLAQRPNVGWLLVGGEKMPFIRDEQATRLNTFRELGVSYLAPVPGNLEGNPGFAGLVRQPLPAGFRVMDAAVQDLYRESAGNPHFAKELCASMFSSSVTRRDAILTEVEVDDAVTHTARERDVELFVHFWEDGIFGTAAERRRIELGRRHFLTAVASLLRNDVPLSVDRLRATCLGQGIERDEVDKFREEFLRRRILRENAADLEIAVPLFQRWLEVEGIYKLPPKGVAERLAGEMSVEDERLRVSPGELRKLVHGWRDFEYQGRRITREDVEGWLKQFELPAEQRLAFRFLERLILVKDSQVYSGLRSIQRIVANDTSVKLQKGQRALRHIFVSSLGRNGSSGEKYAYQYRVANRIAGNNQIPTDRLIDRLLSNNKVKNVVLVDDFIGSGRTAVKALERICERASELSAHSEIGWFAVAISGTIAGQEAIEASEPALMLGLRAAIAYPVMSADLPLDPGSTVFDEAERQQFRELLHKYSKRTEGSLGFESAAMPVVFPDNCPNNAPPILWAHNDQWQGLFPRGLK